MSTDSSVPRSDRYRLTLTDGYFDTLRAMSSERIALALRENGEPAKSDTKIINIEDGYLLLRDAADIGALAERLMEFADNTDRAAVDIQTEVPADIAQGFVADRERQGKLAAELAQTLQFERTYFEALGPSSQDDPDEWLKGLS